MIRNERGSSGRISLSPRSEQMANNSLSFLSSKADLFALSKFHVALIARMQGRSRRGIKKVEHGQAQGAGTYGAQGYKHPSAAPNTTVIGPA